jgi:glycosyltransferase involved in cell wall biosynthesis
LKILLSIPNAGFSGAEQQILKLAVGLKKNGYDITLCNLDDEGLFTMKALESNFECKVIRRRNHFDIFRLINYGKFIIQSKFDIVISFTSSANNLTRLIKLFFPYTNFFHIAGERGRDLDRITISNWIDSKLSKLSDLIICNSKVQREKLILTEKIKPEKVQVIYNGFDFNQMKNIIPLDLYNEFGIPKGNRVICSVGNLSDHKNIPMYMNVAEKVLSKSDSISFLYVGDGPDLEKYKNETIKRGLNKKVFFIGRRNDVLAILKECNIFILTSAWEGLPNVIIEAMAAKVPMVSTNVDGVSEVITKGHNGYLVKSGDVNKMVDKIYQLLGDDNLCDLFRDNALEIAKSMFGMDKMIDSYEKLIRNAGIS